MNEFHSLEQKLASNLDWHRSRIKFLARFMTALLTTRTVNLAELASVFAGRAQIESHYQRCRRFLKDFDLPLAEIAQFVVKLLKLKAGWTLALDRTNWKFGKMNLNLLVLGLVHQGIAYPLIWFSLDKAGNSHTDERILMMELFLSLFEQEPRPTLVADREFVGKAWLEWLKKNDFNFHLRVHENYLVTNARGQQVALRKLFRQTRINEPLTLVQPRVMWGEAYYFSGCRLASGEYLIVVSPTFEPHAITEYAKRWGIETFFGALKTRGFNLEDTHITQEDRLQKLVAILALTFAWCHQIGLWLHQQKTLLLKNHGRPPKSIFRRGLDCLRRLLTHGTTTNPLLWHQLLNLLSGT